MYTNIHREQFPQFELRRMQGCRASHMWLKAQPQAVHPENGGTATIPHWSSST